MRRSHEPVACTPFDVSPSAHCKLRGREREIGHLRLHNGAPPSITHVTSARGNRRDTSKALE